MRDNYEYVDPDYVYTDLKTGVLRNLPDITDQNDLLFFESTAVLKRTKELEKGYTLNLNPPDNLDIYECYMSGTINGDIEKLATLILKLLY